MTLVKNCIILPWTQVTSSDIVTVIILQLQSPVTTGQHNDTYNDRQWHNEWSRSDAILSSHISYYFYALPYSMDVSVPLPRGGIRVAVMSVACFNILEFALLKLHLLYLEHNLVVTHLNKYVHYTTTLFWHELQVDSNWQ